MRQAGRYFNGLLSRSRPLSWQSPSARPRTVAARRRAWFNAGEWEGACRALNEADNGWPQCVTAGGHVLPGLVKRRAEERALCERDL